MLGEEPESESRMDQLDARTLEELLGGDVVDVAVDETEVTDARDGSSVDEEKIGAALSDLRDDVHRTGELVGPKGLHAAAARHQLSVSELAELELQGEAAGLLPSAASMTAREAIEWGDFEQPIAEVGSVDPLVAWFEAAMAYPLLSGEQEIALARAVEASVEAAVALEAMTSPDARARAQLERIVERGVRAKANFTTANLRLVASIGKRYRGQGLDYLDLLQEGVLGLIRAVEKFEWRLGYKFSTYATWWIRQSVQRAVDNQGRTIRIPVHIHDKIRILKREARKLEVQLQREPTLSELSSVVGLEPAEVAFLKDLELSIVSLDRPLMDNPDAVTLGELIPDSEPDVLDDVEQSLMIESLRIALAKLPDRQRLVLIRRHGLDDGVPDTLEEIGQAMGVTRERIRQIEADALTRLSHSSELRAINDLL